MAHVRLKNRTFLIGCTLVSLFVIPVEAAGLKPDTAAAFDRYIRATDAQMADDIRNGHFFILDRLPDTRRQEVYAKLQHGQIYIEQLHTKEDGKPIHVPEGMIHHWAGVIFIPGATLSRTLAVLQDYDNHENVYKPYVRRSKLMEHNGDEFKVYLRLYQKSIVTVVVNANLDIHYILLNASQALSRSYSTRIAEVESPDKPDEHELPVGNDHGYVWRLYSYWRIEEKDGGVYVQVESIALSRTIPPLLVWLIKPLIRNIPRAVLSDLLSATRKEVVDVKMPASEFERSSPSNATWNSGSCTHSPVLLAGPLGSG